MAAVEKTVLVPYTPVQMYALIDAPELYPTFLPWCSNCTVHERDTQTTVATLGIDYHGVRQQFTTRNIKHPPELMTMRLVDGPFSHLQGEWRFIALGESACKIEFRLNYAFSSNVLEKLVAPVFNHITHTFVDAFVHRAEQIYGS